MAFFQGFLLMVDFVLLYSDWLMSCYLLWFMLASFELFFG